MVFIGLNVNFNKQMYLNIYYNVALKYFYKPKYHFQQVFLNLHHSVVVKLGLYENFQQTSVFELTSLHGIKIGSINMFSTSKSILHYNVVVK